jgi:two-component sensor histidine kinase
LIFRLLIPLVLLGILLNALAVRFMVDPFRTVLSDQTERTLEHVSSMALRVCEDSFDELMRLRLVDNEAMVETMRSDAAERIKAIRDEFLGIELMILEDGIRVVANTGVGEPFDPSLLQLSRRSSEVVPVRLGGELWLLHSRYFPFWRWHVLGLVRESYALAPFYALRRISYLVTYGTLLLLLAGFLVGFYALVNRPLIRIREASRALSAGSFQRIDLDRRDEIGEVIEAFNDMVRDLERNRSAIEASVHEKEVLLREIHHRVKNNLAIVASLLNLQSSSVDSAESAVRAMGASRDRIFSMAKVHEQLCESQNLSHISMGDFIRSLVDGLVAVYAEAALLQLDLDLADVSLEITQAVPCGLIVNELVSNALIHGLTGVAAPRLHVSFQGGEENITLRVEDNGVGLPEGLDPATATSLGLHLIHILADQIHGKVRTERRAGTAFVVSFPPG